MDRKLNLTRRGSRTWKPTVLDTGLGMDNPNVYPNKINTTILKYVDQDKVWDEATCRELHVPSPH